MFCPECGERIDAYAVFCNHCGTNLMRFKASSSGRRTNAGSKIHFDLKQALKYVIPAALLSIVILILIVAAPDTPANALPMFANKFYQVNSDTEVLFFNSANDKFQYETSTGTIYQSLDGSMLLPVMDFDGSNDKLLTEYQLVILQAKGKTVEVTNEASGRECAFSDNGKGVLYLKDTEPDSSGDCHIGTLMHYFNGKTTAVADEVVDYALCISPNGRTIAYIKYYSDGEFTSYYSVNGGAPRKLGENLLPLAISDNAKFIYYAKVYSLDDEDVVLYVKTSKNNIKLGEIDTGSTHITCLFNNDYSELIYSFDNKSYITVDGKDKQKLGNREMHGMLQRKGAQAKSESFPFLGFRMVYSMDTFAGTAMQTSDYEIVYLNNNYEVSKIASDVMQYAVAVDGKTLAYISDGSLYVAKIGPDAAENAIEIDSMEDVTEIDISADGSLLYYINSEDELYCLKGKDFSKSKKIADDVYNAGYCFDGDNSNFFFLVDFIKDSGTLYVSKNGGERKRVAGSTDTAKLISNGIKTYVYANAEDGLCDLYTIEGTELKLLASGIKY